MFEQTNNVTNVHSTKLLHNEKKYIELLFAQFDPLLRTRKNIVFGEL